MYFDGFRSSQPSDCKNNSSGITPDQYAFFDQVLLRPAFWDKSYEGFFLRKIVLCATYFPQTVTKAFVQLTTPRVGKILGPTLKALFGPVRNSPGSCPLALWRPQGPWG